jgi:diaminohydroxyphosphoribosylaminopyrimidine deaminase/5-amino-6-(5-phosphoribosylamino)uracil reductase
MTTHGRVDERMMGLALREGAKGRPSPNPHVGAVLTKRGKVVAKGYHARAGQAHAEVVAIERAKRAARGATLYVTLEPCNHHGRTGPCTEAIIEAGIARVVIGARDPAPHTKGSIRKLRRAGIEVQVGVRRTEAERLIADFAKHIGTGKPYVTLKAAVTLDGRIATKSGDSKWITGPKARRHAHRLRHRSDAVMVGVGTVLADDPQLTVRDVRGKSPLRVILDSRLRTPPDARILDEEAPTLVFHGHRAPRTRAKKLEATGAELVSVSRDRTGLDLEAVLDSLGARKIVRLLVEGGGTLHGALLDRGLVDSAAIFVAPAILGDAEGIPLAIGASRDSIEEAMRLKFPRMRRFGDDILVEGEL